MDAIALLALTLGVFSFGLSIYNFILLKVQALSKPRDLGLEPSNADSIYVPRGLQEEEEDLDQEYNDELDRVSEDYLR